jgi:hypothetical protein
MLRSVCNGYLPGCEIVPYLHQDLAKVVLPLAVIDAPIGIAALIVVYEFGVARGKELGGQLRMLLVFGDLDLLHDR